MARVIAVARPSMAVGLDLTGMRVEEATSVSRAERLIEDALSSDAEMLLIDEDFRGDFSEFLQMRLDRHSGLPLVIFCPAFQEEEANTDAYINAILKPAVGFEIRLD
jgi:vacuolar-type H+-ATPase subunit F/Vma7